MNSLNENSMDFNKSIKINFDGGDLTSDSQDYYCIKNFMKK
jgi:hypothetical protein